MLRWFNYFHIGRAWRARLPKVARLWQYNFRVLQKVIRRHKNWGCMDIDLPQLTMLDYFPYTEKFCAVLSPCDWGQGHTGGFMEKHLLKPLGRALSSCTILRPTHVPCSGIRYQWDWSINIPHVNCILFRKTLKCLLRKLVRPYSCLPFSLWGFYQNILYWC